MSPGCGHFTSEDVRPSEPRVIDAVQWSCKLKYNGSGRRFMIVLQQEPPTYARGMSCSSEIVLEPLIYMNSLNLLISQGRRWDDLLFTWNSVRFDHLFKDAQLVGYRASFPVRLLHSGMGCYFPRPHTIPRTSLDYAVHIVGPLQSPFLVMIVFGWLFANG